MNWGKTAIIGFGFFGVSLLWSMYNAYVPVFLKENFGLSSSAIGSVMTIDNMLAILLLPYLGALSDRTRTRLGRRRPFILIGAPLASFFFIFIPAVSGMGNLPLMMSVLIAMNLSMSIFRSPVIALMPDVTPSKYRSQANGMINLMGGLGALVAFFGGKALYDLDIRLPFYVGAAIALTGCLLVVVLVREPAQTDSTGAEGVSLKATFAELKDNLKQVFQAERSLLFVLLCTLAWSIGFNAIETFFTSYAKYYLGFSESTGAQILGFFSLAFMASAIGAGWLGAKFGRRPMMILGSLVLAAVVLSSLFIEAYVPIASAFVIGGVAFALISVNALPMVLDMAPTGNEGGYTGLYYFSSQAANIIAPPIAGLLIDGLGYQALMIFCATFFVASAAFVSRVKRGEAHE
jgi:maltose/moltooligosaccharide transporter